jgi:hypothetical protein
MKLEASGPMYSLQMVYFRFRQIAKLLTKFTEKEAFQWTPEVETASQTPK